jgi:hypothetical protein
VKCPGISGHESDLQMGLGEVMVLVGSLIIQEVRGRTYRWMVVHRLGLSLC